MAARAPRAVERSGHAACVAREILDREARREQRTRPVRGLHDDGDKREPRDDAIATRKEIGPRPHEHWLLREDRPASLDDRAEERGVLARIGMRESAREYGNRATARPKRATMRLRVDSARPAGDDRDSALGKLCREPARMKPSVGSRTP